MKEKRDDSGSLGTCLLTLVGGAAAMCLLYPFINMAQRPDAIQQLVYFIKGAGMCAGAAILAIALIVLYNSVSAKIASRLIQRSKEYLVRCTTFELEMPQQYGAPPPYRPQEPGQEEGEPVYFFLSLSNHGVMLAAPSPKKTWAWVPGDNALRFTRLNDGHSRPIILWIVSDALYYIIYRQEGNAYSEITPDGKFGFSGELPAQPGDEPVKIVIVNQTFAVKGNLNQPLRRDKPQKLTLVVMDESGRDDPAATRELYQLIYAYLTPDDSGEDDSWMYRSRPTFYW